MGWQCLGMRVHRPSPEKPYPRDLHGLLRFCYDRRCEKAECERDDEPNSSQGPRLLDPTNTRTPPPPIWVPHEGARGLATGPIQGQRVSNIAPILGLGGPTRTRHSVVGRRIAR